MSALRTYELVYIVTPEATEELIASIHEQVEQTTQRMGGSLSKTENWGRRKLAYEIKRQKEGVYVLEVIEGTGELMKELDRRLKVVDQVIRHLVVRVDEEQRVVERTRTRRQTFQERRRVARGLPPRPDPSERPATNDDDAGDLEGIEV
ncbi:MAG TPA: 30S ribosomal protein S6 [Vicinamibacterales bacterium]|jgi:small subunit ribosomal protein S6|nr:30S ribosomal protein S6 [Vicinamibacterales bacterium]